MGDTNTFVADIHLHSHFSRATSKNLNLEHLSRWAQMKGIRVVGTGDIAHPGWLAEMKERLQPAEAGLFRLKPEYANPIRNELFKSCHAPVRFMLAGEISNIYKKKDKVRKIHTVVFMPSFEAVERFQSSLEKIGNIRSDGRPILGLDVRDLLEIVLQTDPEAYLIPAHIWTPWFSLLGSMSGFDSVQECFDDLTGHIFAVETGLSSDPPMNWRLSMLDKYTLVSNSDAHSPPKLGREANVFDTELSYPAIFEALKTGDPLNFHGTIEFFPEEGKYHYDGHRKCGTRWDPETTHKHDGTCTGCGKPVTVGVMHRVDTLADRRSGDVPDARHRYQSLIPLPEVLAEIYGMGVNTKRVNESYDFLLGKLGPELEILQDIPLEELEKLGGSLLAEGVRRMREGQVNIDAGYDGEYGTIRLFNEAERASFTTQLSFLSAQVKSNQNTDLPVDSGMAVSDEISKEYAGPGHQKHAKQVLPASSSKSELTDKGLFDESPDRLFTVLNAEQSRAVKQIHTDLLILAGPGTGKTRTVTHRIAYLVQNQNVSPDAILAVTFTNRAAREMQERLQKLVGSECIAEMTIKTFHSLGLQLLKEIRLTDGSTARPFNLLDEAGQDDFFARLFPDLGQRERKRLRAYISQAKNELLTPEAANSYNPYRQVTGFREIYEAYDASMTADGLLDYDDLVVQAVRHLRESPDARSDYRSRFRWISVDEYQDINCAQYHLMKLMISDKTNLCVIGDPDQAIYGFRGARREFFLRFQQDFPHAETITLNKNYRSTQFILQAAGQLIEKNQPEFERKDPWSDILTRTKLQTYQASTDKAEAEFIVHEIERLVGGTSYFSLDSGRVDQDGNRVDQSFSDFAVLYRISAQSRPLQEAFERSGMPFQTSGEVPFFERRIPRQILDFTRFLNDPHADYYLMRVLASSASGMGKVLLARLSEYVQDSTETVWHILQDEAGLRRLGLSQNPKLREFTKRLNMFLDMARLHPVEQIVRQIAVEVLQDESSKEKNEYEELIRQFASRARDCNGNLSEFLEYATLHKETDDYDERAARVALMTLHSAKGLEFPAVFIVGCEETLMPYEHSQEQLDEAEERRLLYVGMTRAKHRLYLLHARKRFLFGKTVWNAPSRFLNDIDRSLKELRKQEVMKGIAHGKKSNQLDLF